ncbi:MAG: alpha/beta hydrolase [Clostridia bacterium]|nr:alpha/beta hydrolase [Clostridia bacterium]
MDILKPVLLKFWKITEKNDNKRIASQTPTPGITQITDIPYADDNMKEHLLDLYYPEGTTEKLPVIIDVHGGGWLYGYKEINKYYCLKLAEKGFLVASVNYRLADKVQFIDQIADVFSAFSWLSKNLKDYPADTGNIFLVGDSAGGQLVCMSEAIRGSKKLQKAFCVTPTLSFRAIGAICPAVDLLSPNFMMNVNLKSLLGEKPKENPLYKYMNYENVAYLGMAPFYIVTADGDFLRKQAEKLKKILDRHGVENVFYRYTDRLDGKPLQHVFSVVNPYSEPAKREIKTMTDFFKRKIK